MKLKKLMIKKYISYLPTNSFIQYIKNLGLLKI